MQAVARLPQGALVLPGFDFDLPGQVWSGMDDALTAEDHPQFRFRRLMDVLDLRPADVQPWTAATPPTGREPADLAVAAPRAGHRSMADRRPDLPDLCAATGQ